VLCLVADDHAAAVAAAAAVAHLQLIIAKAVCAACFVKLHRAQRGLQASHKAAAAAAVSENMRLHLRHLYVASILVT
jgi:hypothetical protein